jgi:HK97 family phage major capsid protein
MAEQTTTELKQLRAKLINEMRTIIDLSDTEGRPMSSEETQKYDRMETDVDGFTQTIDRREKQTKAENMLADSPAEARVSNRKLTKSERLDTDEYRHAFDKYMRYGANSLVGDEARALQEGTDSEGGFLTQTVLERRLVQTLQDQNIMRQLAMVINTTSDRNISVESTVGSATWTAEEAAYTESDSAFSQISLGAYKIATIMKVSEELMQDSIFDMDSYVGTNFGRRIAEAEEAAFVAGNGSSKPTGATVGASAGVTAASATAITSNEILDLLYSLKRQYRRGASFLMNDSTIKAIRQLKDSNGQYLWQPSLQNGDPDLLGGRPVFASYDMPAATTGLVSVLFGDFKMGYMIADRGTTSFQRLNEIYSSTGQVGFRAYRRVDGKVVLAEAIKKLTMA